MDAENFMILAKIRLDYVANRYNYLVSIGDVKSAELIKAEGEMLCESLNSREDFFILPWLGPLIS